MTLELNDLPFHDPDWPPTPAVEREPRKCRHPRWDRVIALSGERQGDRRCARCGHWFDAAKSRMGKSSRRLGGDQERRIEKVYGPVKRGEYGDAVDHVGRVWRWQAKATRALPPRWLSLITVPMWRIALPTALERPWHGMGPHFTDHSRVVIRSFVRQGVPVRDWLFVGAADARAELGLGIRAGGWWVIPGEWWLDHFGKDE